MKQPFPLPLPHWPGQRLRAGARGSAVPALLLAAVLLLSCSHPARPTGLDALGLSAEERRWLAAHPVITYTFDPYYPPFDLTGKDGEHAGYSADLIAHSGRVLGCEFRAQPVNVWDEGLRQVFEGRIDFITSVVNTEERARSAVFTRPYFIIPPVFLGRVGQPEITHPGDLKGKRVFVTRGYSVVDHLQRHYPGIQLDFVDNDRIGLLRLAFGEGDFAVSDFPVATYTLRQEGITNLRVVGRTGFQYALSFAASRQSPELASILDKVIAHLDSSQREALARKWISLEKRFYQHSEFQTAVAVLLFLALSSAFIAWLLKRTVNRRTADLRAELARRRAAESTISEMNQELLRTVAHAESANQAKSHFLRMMSHEFLTPLNQVQLHAELLEDAVGDSSSEAARDLQAIRASTRNLADHMVEILELVDLESKVVLPADQPLESGPFAESLAGQASPWAESNRNALVIDLKGLPTDFQTDPELLLQALLKLLHNACRFTQDGSVRLQARADEEETVFEVRDSGQGIAPHELERVFEVFSQGEEGLTRAFGGMGLGLAIAQHLVRKMGGRITVDSQPGAGSTFRIHLPRRREETA